MKEAVVLIPMEGGTGRADLRLRPGNTVEMETMFVPDDPELPIVNKVTPYTIMTDLGDTLDVIMQKLEAAMMPKIIKRLKDHQNGVGISHFVIGELDDDIRGA